MFAEIRYVNPFEKIKRFNNGMGVVFPNGTHSGDSFQWRNWYPQIKCNTITEMWIYQTDSTFYGSFGHDDKISCGVGTFGLDLMSLLRVMKIRE